MLLVLICYTFGALALSNPGLSGLQRCVIERSNLQERTVFGKTVHVFGLWVRACFDCLQRDTRHAHDKFACNMTPKMFNDVSKASCLPRWSLTIAAMRPDRSVSFFGSRLIRPFGPFAHKQ